MFGNNTVSEKKTGFLKWSLTGKPLSEALLFPEH